MRHLPKDKTVQKNVKIAVGVLASLALFGGGFAVGAATGNSTDSSGGSATTIGSGSSPATTAAPGTSNAAVRVGVDDIAIDYVVLEESCFDSAGSTMQIEMSPALAPGSSLSLDDFSELRLLVTFDITNTEGGVTRGSFEIDRGRFSAETDRLSFERCNTLPDIVVTRVTER